MIQGEIVHIDHFGNAITNIGADLVDRGRKAVCEATGRRDLRCALTAFYGAVPPDSPLAVIGSSGFLEIGINGGSAAQRFGLKIGDAITVHLT